MDKTIVSTSILYISNGHKNNIHFELHGVEEVKTVHVKRVNLVKETYKCVCRYLDKHPEVSSVIFLYPGSDEEEYSVNEVKDFSFWKKK